MKCEHCPRVFFSARGLRYHKIFHSHLKETANLQASHEDIIGEAVNKEAEAIGTEENVLVDVAIDNQDIVAEEVVETDGVYEIPFSGDGLEDITLCFIDV